MLTRDQIEKAEKLLTHMDGRRSVPYSRRKPPLLHNPPCKKVLDCWVRVYRHLPHVQAVDPPRHKMWRWASRRWEQLIQNELARRNACAQSEKNGSIRTGGIVTTISVKNDMAWYCAHMVRTHSRHL